jgi:hypothetical protein
MDGVPSNTNRSEKGKHCFNVINGPIRVWLMDNLPGAAYVKDRVETSPEQMARSSAHAERLSKETGVRTRIVGW